MKHNILFWSVLPVLLFCHKAPELWARSIHRPQDPKMPYIETHWTHEKGKNYILRSAFLEEYALFKTFNEPFFTANLLPDTAIPYRYDHKKTVAGKELKTLIDRLVQEVRSQQKVFTDFDVLCKKDFNRRACSGLMILKCKQHPFVLKLFMENPKSFVKYASKGIVPTFFFFMSGGINRHMVGFTRVKNMQDMQAFLEKSPEWADKITFPRKWFILPQQSDWIEIVGHNIGSSPLQSIRVPGTYCIMADLIEAERHPSLFNKEDKTTCMSICNHIGCAIDPHLTNFMYEKGTGKIAIIDTEHFLSLVGLKDPMKFTGYFAWVWHLGSYCAERMFFRDKQARHNSQFSVSHTELKYEAGGISSPRTTLASNNHHQSNRL